MKKRNLFVRILCIALCALMLLGVIAVGISTAFAAEEIAVEALPDTGSGSMVVPIVIIALLVAAAVIAVVCVVNGKKKNK